MVLRSIASFISNVSRFDKTYTTPPAARPTNQDTEPVETPSAAAISLAA